MKISKLRTVVCVAALLVGALAVACATGKGGSGSGRVLKVAVCQILCVDDDESGNLRRMEHALERASELGAELATFPETAIWGWVNPDAHTKAQPVPGRVSQRIGQLAQQHNMMICVGLAEKNGDSLHDSVILVEKDGTILAKHRKINTLDFLLKERPYTKGKVGEIPVVKTRFGKIGMLICADTFKEDLVRACGAKQPDILLVPYGWAAEWHKWPDHGKHLASTVSRAAKWAGCSVVGTDLVGQISKGPWRGYTYGGQSVVSDRDGNVLKILKDRDVDVQLIEVPLGR